MCRILCDIRDPVINITDILPTPMETLSTGKTDVKYIYNVRNSLLAFEVSYTNMRGH